MSATQIAAPFDSARAAQTPRSSFSSFRGVWSGALALGVAIGLVTRTDPARADEGQWTPDQLAALDHGQLSSKGLEVDLKDMWSESGGLMRAAVNLSGCSAAFVSATGLLATNHHCAYRALQAQSNPEKDHLKQGFLAKKLGDELEAKGYTVQIVENIRDVTNEVLKDTQNLTDDLVRFKTIDLAQKRLTLDCERKDPSLRCEVASFYLGSQFKLFEKRELRDIRLVYAPPSAIGEYGGEIDNWMWPRHTGDFALLRAYVTAAGKSAEYAPKNLPFKPRHWLEIADSGVRPGDFVAVLGYPNNTKRYLPSLAIERYLQRVFPATAELYTEWLGILNAASEKQPALLIKLAALKKTLANRQKNALGMITGLTRMKLVEKRRREERLMSEWAHKPERKSHADALAALEKLARERNDGFQREFLLEQVTSLPMLAVAIDVVRRAREHRKPDIEREPIYMDRNAVPLWKTQERRLRDFVPEVEAALVASLVIRARQLPEGKRIEALEKFAPPNADRGQLVQAILPRVRASGLTDPEHAKRLFDKAAFSELEHSPDPVLALAGELAAEIEALELIRQTTRGIEARVARPYFEALRAVRPGPVYPDANGTLRFSYARVMGYEPEDGLLARPQSTLTGAIHKHTGHVPFDLPKGLRDKAGAAKTSKWADAHVNDLPVCFLSNADTTGGNSGSPIVNGKGELVGLNFDRVWQNVAGDFGYNPERSRNVAVDIRYMLFLLDRVDKASALLRELGVAESRSATGTNPRPRKSPAPLDAVDSEPAPAASCACGPYGRSRASGAWQLALALAFVARLARKRSTVTL